MDIKFDNLLLYLFGNEENLKFICNQIVPEFDEFIDEDIIFNNDNVNPETRKANYDNIKELVIKFFNDFPIYQEFLHSYSNNPIDHIIEAYVFIKVKSLRKNYFFNIFTDERSVVYNGIDPNKL